MSWSLLQNETILWSGQPVRGFVLTGRDIFMIPFSIMWFGFSLFWESTVLSRPHVPWFFALWGLPFVGVGVFLLFGRFFVDAWLRKGLRYALTDRRILIARPAPFRSLTSLPLDRLADVRLMEGRGGTGTIAFGPPVMVRGRGGFGAWVPALDPSPQFIRIPDAPGVFAQIQNATAAARPAS